MKFTKTTVTTIAKTNLMPTFKTRLSLMHLNISFLAKYFESLTCLLNDLQTSFKIVAITETRIKEGLLFIYM